MERVTLAVRIIRARKLRAADNNGLSDPYVVLRVGDSPPWRSDVIRKTLDPDWDAAAIFSGVALDRTPYAVADVSIVNEDGNRIRHDSYTQAPILTNIMTSMGQNGITTKY